MAKTKPKSKARPRRKSPQRSKSVLLICSREGEAVRRWIEGICGFAAQVGWNLRVIDDYRDFDLDLKAIFEVLNPGGFIVCGSVAYQNFSNSILVRAESPVVFVDTGETLSEDVWSVRHDYTKPAEIVADELAKMGLKSYAFVGMRDPIRWSSARARSFGERLRKFGIEARIYEPTVRTAWEADREALSEFVASLPKPCGIMAASDGRAKQVMEICQQLGERIPENVAIIGVDNDLGICETTVPSLSSVDQEFEVVGRIAAERLDSLMCGKMPKPRQVLHGCAHFVPRESSRRFHIIDNRVKRALELIRRRATDGISVDEVIADNELCHRALSIRFQQVVGHSIRDEINAVRLAAVKDMLRDFSVPILGIAKKCGFTSDNVLQVFFKRETGMSMREWRDTQSFLI